MKAKLEFNLPEENEEFRIMSNGINWFNVAWELDQYLQNNIRHGSLPESSYLVYEEVRQKLHDIMIDSNLYFE